MATPTSQPASTTTMSRSLAAALTVLMLLRTHPAAAFKLGIPKTAHRSASRGSVTIENVIWAVAVIGIAAIVVVGITTYVTNKTAQIADI
ncbi:MAG: hypothetical protein LBM23_00450 [Propionibacteriaceae bacterium]|jgi:hypothetical protein|nr:hypothetical protein [Propionibacteriaceae bacterium]